MSKKLLGLFAGIVFAVSVMVVPVKAEIPDIGDLSKYSNDQLIEMILEMLAPGSSAGTDTTQTPQTGSSNWVSLGIPQGFQFNTNLKLGMTSNDVKYLQIMLNSDPDTAVAITGAGSKGNETTYFGGLTQQAVVKFQEKYATAVLTPFGLTKGTGLVGTTTRAKLNEIVAQGATTTPTDVSGLSAVDCVTQGYKWDGKKCYTDQLPSVDVSKLGMLDCVTQGYAWDGTKCYNPNAGDTPGTPVVTPVEGAGMEVALASDSPVNSTLITGQSAAPLAKFVITNKDSVEAKVTKVELQRTGVSGDTTLANVYLFDGMTRLTDAATISQGKITFNSPNGVFTIPAGQSIIVTVASDIEAQSTAGQTVGVALIGLTSNIEVKTTFPINGGTQTIASADLAVVTVDDITNPTSAEGTDVKVNAGATGYTVFQAPITVTKREVELKGATFKVIGSIPVDALENIKLYYNGALISDAITLSSDYTARFVLSTPKKIQSGNLEVRADIVKGSSRNFSFSLQNASDLTVVDSAYNVNAVVEGTPKTTATVAVNSGSVSITRDPTFNQTSVTGGVNNVTLAKFNFKAYGEDVKISTLDVLATLTTVEGATTSDVFSTIDNVTIYANGNPITTNKNLTSGSAVTFNLGSSLVIPANTVVSVEIKGDTKGTSTNGGVVTNNASMVKGSIQMDLVAGSNNAQGVSSMQLTSTALTSGQSLEVGAGTLALVVNPSFSDGKITQNTNNQKIGSFVVQAGDSEGVRISNVSVALAFDNGMTTNQLSNLYIKYAGEESDKITPQATNNFSINKEIAANESMIVDVYVDVSTASTDQTVQSTLGVSTYGLSSNISITPAGGVGVGQTMTVAVPKIAAYPTLTSDSLAAQFVLGSQKYEVAKFNFVATDGEVTLDKVTFKVTKGDNLNPNSATKSDTIQSITVAGKTGYVIDSKVTISGLNFVIPSGYAGKALPVEVHYNNVGKEDVANVVSGEVSELFLTEFEYLAGNERAVKDDAYISANKMTVVNAIPSVALKQENRTDLINGGVKLADITVSTEKEGGAILLQTLPISVTSTGDVTIEEAAVVVRDEAGNAITTTGDLEVSAAGTGTASIAFTEGYRIEANASKTFSIYAIAADVKKDNALTTKLGAKSDFKFTDVNSDTANIIGTPIYTYSTNSSVIKNY